MASEYVSQDILDEYYIRSFAAFHYIQAALGTCRVHVKARFVSPPTMAQKLFSLCWAAVALAQYSHATLTYLARFYNLSGMYYACFGIIVLSYTTFLSNILHVRFFNNDTNAKFYLQLQQIDRLMGVSRIKTLNEKMFVNNTMAVLVMVLLQLITFSATIYENLPFLIGLTGFLYTFLALSVEWLYCAELMAYFFVRIRFINAIIENHLQGDVGSVSIKPIGVPTYYVIRCLASAKYDLRTTPIDMYLIAVLQGFASFQKNYKFQMLVFCCQFITFSVLTIETFLLALQTNSLRLTEFVTLPAVLMCNLLLSLLLCLYTETFDRETKRTKGLCITLMARYCDGPLREKGKRMWNTIEHLAPKFNVYNLWDMNAMTVISMLNIITSIAVALLQFTFL